MKNISQELLRRLPGLAQDWHAGEFDAAVFAAQYFLYWQMASHGAQFASRKNRNDPRPMAPEWLAMMETAKGESLRNHMLDWLEHYQFRGVISNVPAALVQWLRGAWSLILREDVPTPLEVLRMQARGRRAVTILTEYPRLCEPVLHKPDAFAFFVHDLEHAYKFFYSPALCAGQCRFFAALEDAYDRDMFASYLDDPEFVTRFHYLMSDMNTHPEHSRQYLRAILVECHLRREQKAPTEPLSSMAERTIEEVMRAMGGGASLAACA